MHLTHNENIKPLEDDMRHLELEEANKTSVDIYMAGFNSHSGKGHKRNYHGGNQQENLKTCCLNHVPTQFFPRFKIITLFTRKINIKSKWYSTQGILVPLKLHFSL